MMKKNNFELVLISLMFLILSLYFVLAAATATSLIINNNVTSLYDEGAFFVNWTAANDAAANYTIYLWMNDNFVSSTANANNSATGYTWANTTEANYTFTIGAVNATGITTNSTTNVSIYVDSTAPLVNWTNSGYTNLTYKKNTDLLTLNISVGDALSGIDSGTSYCVFDINGTNETVSVSPNGWCNTTQLNLTGLADGNHTIDIWANDTVNNVGVNLSTYIVWIDTTVPAATFTCNPSSVTRGSVVTCTCTGTDAGSGVNSSLTTAVVAITTNSTLGLVTTGTSNCTITDYAGNTHNATGSYTVVVSSSSTSRTPPKWTSTIAISENQFQEGYTNKLETKKRIRFKVKNINHHFGVLELTSTTAKIEISSTPQEATLSVGDSRKFDVTEDGYYDILVALNSIADSKADTTIKFINELVTEEAEAMEQTQEAGAIGDANEEEVKKSVFKKWWLWLIVIVIIAGIGYSVKDNFQ